MNKLLVALLLLALHHNVSAQEGTRNVKPATLAVHFGLFDFNSASAVRNTSFISALESDDYFKFRNMSGALGLSFLKGVAPNLDYSVNGFITSLNYPYRNNEGNDGSDNLYTAIDAMAHLKLLPDNYILSPYISGGIGGSIYSGWRLDAYLPVGAGLQLRLGDKNFAFANAQYRLPVTSRTNYHFLFSFGVATKLK